MRTLWVSYTLGLAEGLKIAYSESGQDSPLSTPSMVKVQTTPTGHKGGRPQKKYVGETVEEIFRYLDEQDKDLYSMDKLIGSDKWCKARHEVGVVQTPAAIMRTDIQSRTYDTKSYPPSDEFLNGAEEMVPAMSLAFMDALIPKRKRDKEEVVTKRVCNSHAMISAFRQEMPEIPKWKGFMHLVCELINSEKSAAIPVPFINSPPSDDNMLYTTLRYVAEDATHLRLMISDTDVRFEKRRVGLTQGRSLSDSVLAKWVGGARTATAICSSLEVLAGVHCMSGEQHVDFRVSQINRDDQDRGKLARWLADHPPFAVCDSIMSLSTGVIGNSNINCHKAAEIGSRTMGIFVGTNLADMKQSKRNAVVPLAAMSNTIKKHEVPPYPRTLFEEGCMPKTKKAALYNAIPLCSSSVDLKTSYTVVDGGFLLHRVKWNIGTKFSSICEQYIPYLVNHYRDNSAVVFDGYEDQVNFLANEKNKTKLIELLVEMLNARGTKASTTTGDADGSIVRCGLNKVTSHSSVVVIGENVDLLVLLTALSPSERNKCFLKMPNETKAIADNFYDLTSTPDAVAQGGEEMFFTMYQAP
ncbi:hypothetical protein PR048_031899 [Dryococelus australis]|uniref:Uncharacterized protein n=1 Tax=Dryococelus australis TaxID=614101 RepID=A0ABQ9G6L1_9NEOP|nr:hypothetical protein PR048_031899 [Dryococelus australis]